MNKNLIYLKKATIFLLLLSLFLNFPVQQVCANQKQNIEVTTNDNISISTDQATRIPNIIKVGVEKVSDNKVRVYVSNTGVDVFDSVTCYVTITDKQGFVQYSDAIKFTNIYPLIHRTYDIFVLNWSEVKVGSIRCQDGDDFGTLLPVILKNPTFN